MIVAAVVYLCISMAVAFAAGYWFRGRNQPCEHLHQRCVHGDEINAVGGRRAQCLGCGRYLRDLPAVCSVSGEPH